MPAPRRQDDRARLVLEQPPGEVPPGPLGRGGDPDRAPGAVRVLEDLAECDRHPVVGDQMVRDGLAVGGGDPRRVR